MLSTQKLSVVVMKATASPKFHCFPKRNPGQAHAELHTSLTIGRPEISFVFQKNPILACKLNVSVFKPCVITI